MLECMHGKIAKMFVVDLIKAALSNQITHPMRFGDKYSIIRKQSLDPLADVVQLINVSEHVCSKNETRLAFFCNDLVGEFRREELLFCRNSFLLRYCRHGGSGFYAQDATLLYLFEKSAVV